MSNVATAASGKYIGNSRCAFLWVWASSTSRYPALPHLEGEGAWQEPVSNQSNWAKPQLSVVGSNNRMPVIEETAFDILALTPISDLH